MRWTAIRARFETLLADSVRGHVALNTTRYQHAHDYEGRGWITWDGRQIASFESMTYLIRTYGLVKELKEAAVGPANAWDFAESVARREEIYPLDDFRKAVADYPDMSIDAALASDDPITRGLAMLDRRLGKRRLISSAFANDPSHVVRDLYRLRCEAEGLAAR
jgi:hypothetical protein